MSVLKTIGVLVLSVGSVVSAYQIFRSIVRLGLKKIFGGSYLVPLLLDAFLRLHRLDRVHEAVLDSARVAPCLVSFARSGACPAHLA
jgi:hypothetical protein